MESTAFGHLRQSDLVHIKSLVETGKVQEVLNAFRQWLALWQSGQWMDEERIYFNVVDLRQAGVWEQVTLESFVETLQGTVCSEVLAIIARPSFAS